MGKKSIEDKFSIDMDDYFSSIEDHNKLESKEYNELLELGKTLADKDFSKESNKEAIFNRTLKNINEYKGDNVMKKLNKKRRNVAVASVAAVILSVSLMQTSFARDAVDKIIKSISLGHINVVQMEPSKERPKAQELKGKLVDKDGNPLKVHSKIQRKDGEIVEVVSIEDEDNGKVIKLSDGAMIISKSTKNGEEEKQNKNVLEVKDTKEINKHTCFNVNLPTYLPEGYKFDRAEVYKEEKEANVTNSKYVDLYFTNDKTGNFMSMQQRIADEETGYTTGTDGKVEKIKINGVDAVISDDSKIDWEANNTLYILSAGGSIEKDELIKTAESIK